MSEGEKPSIPSRERLLATGPEERNPRLLAFLAGVFGAALSQPAESLGPEFPVRRLAREPATVVALVIALRDALDFRLYPNELAESPTLGALAEAIGDDLARRSVSLQALPSWPADPRKRDGMWGWDRSPAPVAEARLPETVFVFSAPRSGSTLLRVMLAGHPALFSPPELCLLPFGDMGDRQRQLDRSGYGFMNRGLAQALQAALRLDPAETEALMRRQVEERWPVAEVYGTLQEAAGERRLVDKSPMYSANREWMARAETLFSEARYVHLVRHPYSVIESFVRMRFDRLLGPLWGTWDDHPAVFAERTWTAWNREILAFLSEVPTERQHRIRYEDLVVSPAAEVERLCASLGLPPHAAMLEPYSDETGSARMLRDASTGRFTIGDPNILTHAGIEPSLGEGWREVRLPFPPGRETAELAAAFGYELP